MIVRDLRELHPKYSLLACRTPTFRKMMAPREARVAVISAATPIIRCRLEPIRSIASSPFNESLGDFLAR
jgi:hypothetical protein